MNNPIEELIVSRRTINHFEPQCPDRQIIIDAIDTARWVPNHHLTQPWHFYFPNDQMISQIIELNAQLVENKKNKAAGDAKRERWSAIPGWLVVTCNKSNDELQQAEDYAACCCSIYALSLILWQKNIGVKWTTGQVMRQSEFYDICWLDRLSQNVVGLLWYGYPDEKPVAQPRRQTQEIVTQY